jgi:hypothetical protein
MRRELTTHELLDRYVHAVTLMLMLPPGKVEDIAAEVRSNLESQIDDRAMTLGRELRPEEVSAMLKQYGHPAKVAQQYRELPGRGLIGPTLFPFYWFTLRAILAVWMTIRVIVAVFTLQGTSPAGTVLLAFGRDVVIAALIIPAGVTLLFAVWEHLELTFRYSERWRPETLAAVPRPGRQSPKPRPMVHIIGGIAWLLFLALALYSPWFFWVWGARGTFSPSDALHALRFPLWLLAFAGISQSWLGHTRFAARRWRQVLRIGVVMAGIALAVFLLTTGDLLIAGPKWDPTRARSLATLNQMIAGVLVLACILAGLAFLQTFSRIIRRSNGHSPTADVAS